MKKFITIVSVILITVSISHAQKEYYNWYFGDKAGISFNIPDLEPVFLSGNTSYVAENSSVISDYNGNLLMYSMHDTLFNSEGEVIQTGDNIDGHYSSTQGSIIVKICKNKFIRIGADYTGGDLNKPVDANLSYMIIKKNGGNFSASKKKIIMEEYFSEKLLVVKDKCNGSFFLVLFDEIDSKYYLYKYDILRDEFRKLQTLAGNGIHQGYLKSSIDGKYIVSNSTKLSPNKINKSIIEFLKLDCKKGRLKVIDSLQLNGWNYSGEFSPNGEYYYFLEEGKGLYAITNIKDLNNSKPKIKEIFSDINVPLNQNLQLGPNGKIYITEGNLRSKGNYLSAIENPNNIDNPQYIEKAVLLEGGARSKVSFPNIPTTFYYEGIYDCKDICEGEDLEIEVDLHGFIPDPSYEWTGPNGFTSTEQSFTIENAKPEHTGSYTVKVYNGNNSYITETNVFVRENPKPNIRINPKDTLCKVDTVRLNTVGDFEIYEWSTGDTTKETTVYESGTYRLMVKDENGCTGYSEVEVIIAKDDLTMDIIAPDTICNGAEVTLLSDKNYTEYKWSTEDTTKSINITKGGEYWLHVITEDGCEIKDTIFIEEYPEVNAKLKPVPKSICQGDTLVLEPQETRDSYNYDWSNGKETISIIVTESGTYKLKIIDSTTGCKDSTEVTIDVEDDLKPTIDGKDLCNNETVTLTALPNDESYRYEWNTGDTTASIEVNEPDVYSVTVSKGRCSGTAVLEVRQHSLPEFEIVGDTIVCEGGTTEISSSKEFADYLWSTDETNKTIKVGEGTYELTVTDENGCSNTKEITIKEGTEINPSIEGSQICGNGTATLTVYPNDDSYTYEWNDGFIGLEREVSDARTYTVTVSKDNCSGTATIEVKQFPLPEFTIEGDRIICEGESTTLTASKEFKEYVWSNGDTTRSITVGDGNYTLTVTDENGCTASRDIEIEERNLTFDISKNSIDFGKIYISDTREDSIVIVNTSGYDVVFDGNYVLMDGQTFQFNKTLDPDKIGQYNEELTLNITDPCDTTLKFDVTAEVYARVTLSTINLHTKIGATETIPYYIEAEANLGEQEFNITTDIERDLFLTDDSYKIPSPQVINQQRTKIHEQTGMILLTEFSNYPITFSQIEFDNTYIEKNPISGEITFDSVCIHDLRVVEIHEPTEISVAPNPVHDIINIDISTGEEGNFTIELISTEGRTTYTDSWNQSSSSKNIQIDTRDISTGVYQLRLTTEGHIYRKEVVVVE